jgi:hypothetical protein
MAISGRLDLLPAHVINATIGAVTCGLVVVLTHRLTQDGPMSLVAGLTLAASPWHIAYSWMNMPDVPAGALLACLVLAAIADRSLFLLILGFAGALTRHEVTLCCGMIALWLLLRGRWLSASLLSFGVLAALGFWSLWSWHLTGSALDWWYRYSAMTRWDASFFHTLGIRPTTLKFLIAVVQQTYAPALLTASLVVILVCRGRTAFSSEAWLVISLVIAHGAALTSGYLGGTLPVFDPRLLLVTLPLATVVGALAIGRFQNPAVRISLVAIQMAVVVYSAVAQLPTFRGRAAYLHPAQAAGRYLASQNEGAFWVDSPVAIYASGLPLARFVSSEDLLRGELPAPAAGRVAAMRAIRELGIRYVLCEHVSYSATWVVWPEMERNREFVDGRLRFTPVFQYGGWELQYGATPVTLWKVNDERPNGTASE